MDYRAYLKAAVAAAHLIAAGGNPPFKRDPSFRAVVGNDMRGVAVAAALARYLGNTIGVDVINRLCAINDALGAPAVHESDGVRASAASLRYLQTAAAVLESRPRCVVEIGGGYGGQAVMLKLYAEFLGVSVRYVIVDLPDALLLAAAYCGRCSVGIECVSAEDAGAVQWKKATVVSDFALTEFSESERARYLPLVLRARRLRITGMPDDDFLQAVRAEFRNCTVAAENPPLTAHHNLTVTAWR